MKTKILLIVTGSISIYKTAELVSQLKKLNYELRIVMSQGAMKFIQPVLFEGLSDHKVYHSLWNDDESMNHIYLNRWADLILVAPASANFIAKAAQGLCSDLASTLVNSHDFKKPFLIAPAMNTAMFMHPATQLNLQRLLSWGYQVLPSPSGTMACGENGMGRLLEPSELILAIQRALSKHLPQKKQNILITAGGTSVPIDAVRRVTNTSTGRSGSLLASSAFRQGHQVTLLSSNLDSLSTELRQQIACHSFYSPDDLEQLLFKELNQHSYDLILHLAAVSDFDIQHVDQDTKITSSHPLTINLIPREKTICKIRQWAPHAQLVGFKLTSHLGTEDRLTKVQKLFKDSRANFVVHNALEEINSASHPFVIYNETLKTCYQGHNITELLDFFLNQETLT